MRDFSYRICEDAEVFFYLYDANTSRQITERFLVKISKDGFIDATYIDVPHSNCTVFTDLGKFARRKIKRKLKTNFYFNIFATGEAELNSELYIVANVIRVGKIQYSDTSVRKSMDKGYLQQFYRRPFGVGVVKVSDAQFDCAVEPLEERELTFKLYTCDEKDFHQLHELIIKNTGKYSPINASGSSYGISISLRLIYGGLNIQSEHPILFQGTITKKIGFPSVILPGDVRNDLFLVIERGGN
jgi:dedicator of cytokinesis protein 3